MSGVLESPPHTFATLFAPQISEGHKGKEAHPTQAIFSLKAVAAHGLPKNANRSPAAMLKKA